MSKAFTQVQLLNNMGLNYFDFGVIKQGRKKLFDYFKTDKINAAQIEVLQNAGCVIKYSRPQYAPELISALICFPKGWKGLNHV